MKPIVAPVLLDSQDLNPTKSLGGQSLSPSDHRLEHLEPQGLPVSWDRAYWERLAKEHPEYLIDSRASEHRPAVRRRYEDKFAESLTDARVAYAGRVTELKVLSERIEAIMRELALESCQDEQDTYLSYATELSRCHSELLATTRKTKVDAYYRRYAPFFSCHRRWCPICSARRTRLRQALLAKKLKAFSDEREFLGEKVHYTMITLTVKNCPPEKVEEAVNCMQDGLKRMTNRAFWKRQVLGYIKTLEITENKNTGEVHPHIHLLVAVRESYFKSKDYISKPRLIKLWRHSCRLNYDPNVDIRPVGIKKEKSGKVVVLPTEEEVRKAAWYVMKYQTKPEDLGKTSNLLIKALIRLKGKRFADGAGCFRGIYKEIEDFDPPWEKVDGPDLDLVPHKDDVIVSAAVYWWRTDRKKYLRRLDGTFAFGITTRESKMVCAVDRLNISREWLAAGGSWEEYLDVPLLAKGWTRPARKPKNTNPWANAEWDYSGTLDMMAAEAGGQSQVAVADGYDGDLPW